MATKAWVSKQKRREELVKKFADLRRQLKKEKNYAALAKLPSKLQLQATLVGSLTAPLAQTVAVLQAPLAQLIRILNAKSQQAA